MRDLALTFLIIFLSLNSLSQQLPDFQTDDPFEFQSFRSEFIKQKKIRSIKIKVSNKALSRPIIDQPAHHQYFYDSDGKLFRQVTTISVPGLEKDSTIRNIYYAGERVALENTHTSASSETVQYAYDLNRDIIQLEKKNQYGDITRVSTSTYERQTVSAEKLITRIYLNGGLTHTITDILNPDKSISERTKVQNQQGYKVTSRFEYLDGRLKKVSLKEFGVETLIDLGYTKEGNRKTITLIRSGKEVESMEYFYYNGLIESALKTRAGSNEVEIINYSYEFY